MNLALAVLFLQFANDEKEDHTTPAAKVAAEARARGLAAPGPNEPPRNDSDSDSDESEAKEARGMAHAVGLQPLGAQQTPRVSRGN